MHKIIIFQFKISIVSRTKMTEVEKAETMQLQVRSASRRYESKLLIHTQ